MYEMNMNHMVAFKLLKSSFLTLIFYFCNLNILILSETLLINIRTISGKSVFKLSGSARLNNPDPNPRLLWDHGAVFTTIYYLLPVHRYQDKIRITIQGPACLWGEYQYLEG